MITKTNISKTICTLLLSLSISLITTTCIAATYYVDAVNGNDSNSGQSEALAWKSIAKVNSSSFKAGDSILFKRGQRWNDTLVIPSSGAKDYPITFSSYGSGDLPIIDGSGKEYCIKWDRHYIVVDGLHLTKSGKNAIGQWAAPADYGVLRNCLIDYNARMGMYTGSSATSNTENWLIENNVFAYNGADPVYDHGIYIRWAKNFIIQNNSFIGNAAYGMDINGSSNNIIRYNYSEGQGRGFMEFYEGGADYSGGSQNNEVYYNVSNGDPRFLYSGGGPNHIGNKVYNNTIYNFSWIGIYVDDGNLAELKNNIIWSTNPNASKNIAVDAGSAILASSNNAFGPLAFNYQGSWYGSYSAFASAHPELTKGSTASDPRFADPANNDLHINEDSPCYQAGIKLDLTRDFEGNIIGAALPNIGAYETAADGVTPPQNLRIISQ